MVIWYRWRRKHASPCRRGVGPNQSWAGVTKSGVPALASQATHEEDPADPTGQTVLPYVVKIDPPDGRLINEVNSLVRPFIHSGQDRPARRTAHLCADGRGVRVRRAEALNAWALKGWRSVP